MENIGSSSLWCEKYRPQTLKDYICSDQNRKLFQSVIDSTEVPCFTFYGGAGCGKTSLARIIANELKMDLLYINGSMETSVDVIRYKVQQFVMTSSFSDGKKLVIIDETERISTNAAESLKVLQEESEANARFIFCTNNIQKMIPPLLSRSQVIQFGKEISKDLVLQTFKRLQFILENEGIEFDKKVLAELTQKFFPDIRKLINELQKFAAMNGSIDTRIFTAGDDTQLNNLVDELRNKKFNNVRKIVTELDDPFYSAFYAEIDKLLVDSCKPNVILALAESAYRSALTVNKELELVSCCIQIMQQAVWK
jgi:DNA polymerase III delta prime subunit